METDIDFGWNIFPSLANTARARLTGLWIFHHIIVGKFETPPPTFYLKLLDLIAENGKGVRKIVRKHYKSISVNFSLRSIFWSPEIIKAHF